MTVLLSKQQGAPVTGMTKASSLRHLSFSEFSTSDNILEAARNNNALSKNSICWCF